MKVNRRNFIRKSASLTASLSIAGIGTGMAEGVDHQAKSTTVKKALALAKDGGMEFSLLMPGLDSPRIALAKQMAFMEPSAALEIPATSSHGSPRRYWL